MNQIIFLVLTLGLKYIYSQAIQECENQNTYYDLDSQNCGICLKNCKQCSDFSSCQLCQKNLYYEQSTAECVEKCQIGQLQDNYFGHCIECKVENCNICQYDGKSCKQCKQGWQLSNDQKNCLKSECLASNYSFYNPLTDSCTFNCPESSSQDTKSCVSLKKMSQIKTLSSRSKVNQKDIKYVFYFEQINGKPMIVTLDDSSAILYSYPELIPLNQIAFIKSFLKVVKDDQNIYLIDIQNVQRIDLVLQFINIIYSTIDTIKSFSQKQLFSFSVNQQNINMFTFSTGQILTYQIKNQFIIDFDPYFFNKETSNNNPNENSPSQYDFPQENDKIPKVLTVIDNSGCLLIENNPEQLNPTIQSFNMIQRDYLLENQIVQQKIINQTNMLQNNSIIFYLESLDSSFTFNIFDGSNPQLFYLNSNILIKAQNLQKLDKMQILNVFQYDGKTRLVIINPDNYNGIYESAVVCANLTQNLTSSQYYFEYDMPHYAQTTSQIVEYIITDDNNFLIIASSLGYEIVNISPQQSMIITESKQNQIYFFSNLNDNLFSHSKFLSKNSSLYYQIAEDNIQIQLLSFNNQSFSSKIQYEINLKSMNYPNFNINCNQVQMIDNQTFIFSYNNQLIKIIYSATNQIQTFQYSSFTEQDSAYYMNGIFRILYSEDASIMAIVFNSGFRIIKVNSQRLLSEKNLRQQIVQADIVSQLLVIVYQYNDQYYNFVVVSFENGNLYQYEIPSGSIYIYLVKQQNPVRVFLGIYYSDSITLFCISQQKTDIFQINASPQQQKDNFNTVIQVISDTLYINTIEYYILVYAYDPVNSQLNWIDNIFTQNLFSLIDNKISIIINMCQNEMKYSIFNRIQKSNYILQYLKVYSNNICMVETIHSTQYNKLLILPLQFMLGQQSITIFDLVTYTMQKMYFDKIPFSNDAYFITQYQKLYQLNSFNNLQNSTNLNFPQPFTISSNTDFLQLQGSTYILVQNITNQLFLFKIQNLQLTQIFLKSHSEDFQTIISINQIVLYSHEDIVANYALGYNNFNIPDVKISDTNFQKMSKYNSKIMLISNHNNYYFDLDTNQYLILDIKPSLSLNIMSSYMIIKNKQLFGTNQKKQFEVTDLQFNQLHLFVNQSQVQYIQELDSFISIFIFISQYTLSIINYSNCQIQSTQLQGLQFLVNNQRLIPIYIFIDKDLDTLIITSYNRLNIFQLSTLNYLGSQDYNGYYNSNIINYSQLSNTLAIQQGGSPYIQLFELWTPIFSNLYQNSLKSYKNRFMYNSDSNTAVYFNYNSNILNIFDSENYQILYQLKFNQSLSTTQYFIQIYKISFSTILAITSNSELLIYDFLQNKQIKFISSSFNCFLFTNYSYDIYCLENNSILKKFNNTTLDFTTIFDKAIIQIQVSELQALSSELIAFISLQGKIIEQVGQNIIIKSLHSLQVYYLQSQANFQNITSSLQYNKAGQQILDFIIIKYNNSCTLILATNLNINIYNLQTNQQIGNLPTPCQNSLQLKQDEQYLYMICSFQVSIFDKRIMKLINYKKINQFTYSNIKDVMNIYQDLFAFILYNEVILVKINYLKNQIIESFTNLDNPQIYQINMVYQNQGKQPSQIKLKCYSDSNLFDILYSTENTNYLSLDTQLNFVQSTLTSDNTFQHQDLQNRIFIHGLNLIKYNIQMTIEQSKLEQIQIFFDVFTQQTIVEYSFPIQQSSFVKKGIVNLTDSNFIQQQIQALNFKTITLQINLNQNNLTLNKFGSLKSLVFSEVDLIFDQNCQGSFLQEFGFSVLQNSILSITTLQADISNMNFTNISSLNSLITLNLQNELLLENSLFQNIYLYKGSTISITQGKFYVTQSQFLNITSLSSPCALDIQQLEIFQVRSTRFINLINNITEINSSYSNNQGGAIGIQNSKQTLIENSLFQNCSSFKEGGAIYSSYQVQGTFIIYMCNFKENQSIQSSGGALFLTQLSSGVNITKSNFTKNKALFQNGGAISIDTSNLLQFSDNIFSFNQAIIGGSIYYYKVDSKLINKNALIQNSIIFNFNEASFYGQNIGSLPKYIGITSKSELNTLKIIEEYSIHNISSGNYLNQKLYLNFIDEENNPFNFLGSDIYYDRSQFYFQLNIQNNNQIIIQEGLSTVLNKTIGMFELNFQSSYKLSQSQTINIISNQFQQGFFLSIPLNLHYRNCIIGEIVQESNQFISCSQCVQGRYSLKTPDMQNDINKLQCISCPEQAYFCQGSEIKLKDGYWRESNLTYKIYTCLLDSCSFDNTLSKQGCLTGYVGPLCNSCDNKESTWGQQYGLKDQICYPCKQQSSQIAYACFFIILYVFYLTMSLQNIIASKIRVIKLKIFKQIGLLITSNLSSSGNELTLWYKIFINYLQILSCLIYFQNFNHHFFAIPVNILGDPIKVTVTSFDCLFKISDKYPLWLNRILTQLFSIIIIFLLALAVILIILLRSYKKRQQAIQKFPQMVKMSLIFIYIFYQPSISKILIQSMICIKIGSKFYLTSDYSQECYDYYHLLYSLTIIFPLIIIICFFVPYFLYSKLIQLKKIDSLNQQISQKVENIMQYGFLYSGYKNQYLYWEIIKIFYKFILMILINIVLEDNIKLMLIICLIILYNQQFQKNEPYSNRKIFQEEKNLMERLIFTYLMLFAILNDFTNDKILSQISLIIILLINISSTQIVFIILGGQINFIKDKPNPITNLIKKTILKIKQKYPNFLRLLRIRQVELTRIHFLWKKVILNVKKNVYKHENICNQLLRKQTKKNDILEKNNSTQNQELKEVKYSVFSSNTLLKQDDINQNLKIEKNFQLEFPPQQTELEKQEIFKNIQISLKENKNQIQDNLQYSNHLQFSQTSNNKNIPAPQSPNQLESSHESSLIFEQELNNCQMTQKNIFDNIIAPNKFKVNNQKIQKKLE
ncbi:hypothetical protein ABPG72_010708 [Tetrahymena utriculariae]